MVYHPSHSHEVRKYVKKSAEVGEHIPQGKKKNEDRERKGEKKNRIRPHVTTHVHVDDNHMQGTRTLEW